MTTEQQEQHEVPIRREDATGVALEFTRRWKPGMIVDKGFVGAVEELVHQLQDSGDILILSVDEQFALSEWLCDGPLIGGEPIGIQVFDADADVNDKLRSAVKKLLFAH